MIIFKDNCRFKVWTKELNYIFNTLFNLNEQKIPDYPIEWMITSVNDSTHLPNSKHYKDKAIDMRSHNFNSNVKEQFRKVLELHLGPRYTILLEDLNTPNEHFHIQLAKGL